MVRSAGTPAESGIHDRSRHHARWRITAHGGRFQQGFDQLIYIGSNETHPEPPQDAPSASSHDLGSYAGQLVEASPDGKPLRYNYAVGHTIQDVIAAEGPWLPDVDHSQRRFNTGIVVAVEHGKDPSSELIERARDIGNNGSSSGEPRRDVARPRA